MAVVHNTTLVPSKLELLAEWMPQQPWFAGTGTPSLARAGGFRLDDPEGEVGIEFLVVTDSAGDEVVSYLVPMTYRAAPLDGADGALIGTSEHGVLGHRYFYDGPHDPVLVAQLRALVQGGCVAQAQTRSNEVDESVRVGTLGAAQDVRIVRVLARSSADPDVGEVSVPWTLPDGTQARGIVAIGR